MNEDEVQAFQNALTTSEEALVPKTEIQIEFESHISDRKAQNWNFYRQKPITMVFKENKKGKTVTFHVTSPPIQDREKRVVPLTVVHTTRGLFNQIKYNVSGKCLQVWKVQQFRH